jgi:hypothetical protein
LPDTTTSQIIKQGSFQAFADMAYPSGSMVNEFDDVDLALAANEDLNDVGFLDSTGAAFMQEGLVTGGFKASNQFLDRAQMDTDAGFEVTSLYDTDESFRKRLDPLLQDSIRNERVLSQVVPQAAGPSPPGLDQKRAGPQPGRPRAQRPGGPVLPGPA